MSFVVEFPDVDYVEMKFREALSPEAFLDLCMRNKELIAEREPDGTVTFMSPLTFLSGNKESRVNAYLTIWSIENGMGETASSSAGFTLPNGAVRSPDAAWVSDERMSTVSDEELDRFPKLVPDFVVEIRSKTDSLKQVQRKMVEEWMGQGVRLGWLIDPKQEKVYVYRSDESISVHEGLSGELTGEDVMPGFTFDLEKLKMKKR